MSHVKGAFPPAVGHQPTGKQRIKAKKGNQNVNSWRAVGEILTVNIIENFFSESVMMLMMALAFRKIYLFV